MQKVDELKIFRSVPHMINTDCDANHMHRLSCYILLRRSACTRIDYLAVTQEPGVRFPTAEKVASNVAPPQWT